MKLIGFGSGVILLNVDFASCDTVTSCDTLSQHAPNKIHSRIHGVWCLYLALHWCQALVLGSALVPAPRCVCIVPGPWLVLIPARLASSGAQRDTMADQNAT